MNRTSAELDAYITGNYGNDRFADREDEEIRRCLVMKAELEHKDKIIEALASALVQAAEIEIPILASVPFEDRVESTLEWAENWVRDHE